MSEGAKTTLFQWAKFLVGALSLAGLLYIHAYVKDLPMWLMGLPFVLLGVDPAAIFKNFKK